MREPSTTAVTPDRALCRRGETAGMVGGMQRGVLAEFDALYERAAPALYAWTNIRLARIGRADLDADDVLQETWLRAFDGFQRFRPERSSFRGWILGVAKRVLLEELRRRRPLRTAPQPSRSTVEWFDHCRASVTSISSRLARDEALRQFLARVEKLDPVDGMILLHCGFEEYSNAEAATRLGLSPEAVKKRWQRLRSRLAENALGRQFFGAA